MKILFTGLGSIGKRHARLLLENFDHQIFALRSGKSPDSGITGVTELRSWEEVDAVRPDLAFITNPTFLHIRTAIDCAMRGMHLFMEKPIDCTDNGLEQLLKLVRQRSLTAYIAYPLRFHPVIKALKAKIADVSILHARVVYTSFLPDWRPGRDPRTSYSAKREQGGGVLLDLSHEMDYCEHLFGPLRSVDGRAGRISNVTVDAEDYADLLCEYERALVNVHLDTFSRSSQRFIEVEIQDRHIHADLLHNRIRCVEAGQEKTTEFACDRDDVMLAQLKYFFENINNPELNNDIASASKLFLKLLEFRKGSVA